MDTENIYDDLRNVDLGERVLQLQSQKTKLILYSQSLESDVEKLCNEITQMKKSKDILTRNISELYNTAKLEMQRKDKMISELNRKLDDLLFKRSYNRYNDAELRLKAFDSSTRNNIATDVLQIKRSRSKSRSPAHKINRKNYMDKKQVEKLSIKSSRSKSRSPVHKINRKQDIVDYTVERLARKRSRSKSRSPAYNRSRKCDIEQRNVPTFATRQPRCNSYMLEKREQSVSRSPPRRSHRTRSRSRSREPKRKRVEIRKNREKGKDENSAEVKKQLVYENEEKNEDHCGKTNFIKSKNIGNIPLGKKRALACNESIKDTNCIEKDNFQLGTSKCTVTDNTVVFLDSKLDSPKDNRNNNSIYKKSTKNIITEVNDNQKNIENTDNNKEKSRRTTEMDSKTNLILETQKTYSNLKTDDKSSIKLENSSGITKGVETLDICLKTATKNSVKLETTKAMEKDTKSHKTKLAVNDKGSKKRKILADTTEKNAITIKSESKTTLRVKVEPVEQLNKDGVSKLSDVLNTNTLKNIEKTDNNKEKSSRTTEMDSKTNLILEMRKTYSNLEMDDKSSIKLENCTDTMKNVATRDISLKTATKKSIKLGTTKAIQKNTKNHKTKLAINDKGPKESKILADTTEKNAVTIKSENKISLPVKVEPVKQLNKDGVPKLSDFLNTNTLENKDKTRKINLQVNDIAAKKFETVAAMPENTSITVKSDLEKETILQIKAEPDKKWNKGGIPPKLSVILNTNTSKKDTKIRKIKLDVTDVPPKNSEPPADISETKTVKSELEKKTNLQVEQLERLSNNCVVNLTDTLNINTQNKDVKTGESDLYVTDKCCKQSETLADCTAHPATIIKSSATNKKTLQVKVEPHAKLTSSGECNSSDILSTDSFKKNTKLCENNLDNTDKSFKSSETRAPSTEKPSIKSNTINEQANVEPVARLNNDGVSNLSHIINPNREGFDIKSKNAITTLINRQTSDLHTAKPDVHKAETNGIPIDVFNISNKNNDTNNTEVVPTVVTNRTATYNRGRRRCVIQLIGK